MAITICESLPAVSTIKAEFPLSPHAKQTKTNLEFKLKGILSGADHRRLLIIGPCAADFEYSVIEYISKLSSLQHEVKDKLLIIPRVYTAKPRSSFSGYTGMIYYPTPSGPQNISEGIRHARKLHLRILDEFDMISADELLYGDLIEYLQDVVSYFAIGARSVEYQVLPWLASGLDCPVGIKNSRCGDPGVLVRAIAAVQKEHTFSFGGSIVNTTGNKYAHGILRGFSDCAGIPHSNINLLLDESFYQNYHSICGTSPRLIVDCSHDNSGRNACNQVDVLHRVLSLINTCSPASESIRGFMLESYLLPGKCNCSMTQIGKSVVDECIGWEETQAVVRQIANQLH